jgi:benzylsuccinate CoA-transferase BbsF subunit
MADYGAVVVRIESQRRPDAMRSVPPFHNGEPGLENSASFQNLNAGKNGLTLDLSKPAGRAVCLDLVGWADVVMESYSPKVMKAWQLDYDTLCHIKPDLIMFSSSLMGQTGPVSTFAGIGNLGAALAGFFYLTGWPDRPPAGPFGAYTDYVSPRFSVARILAALDHRRRTGEGQYLDQSHIESSLHFLAPALLDYTVNDRAQERVGNRDEQVAPHGVYPAMGEDQWVAIAVETDAQWRQLCQVMEQPELQDDSRFETAAARVAAQDALDPMVTAWTQTHHMYALEARLQAHGIPASSVRGMHDLYEDPQLRHHNHFVPLDQSFAWDNNG